MFKTFACAFALTIAAVSASADGPRPSVSLAAAQGPSVEQVRAAPATKCSVRWERAYDASGAYTGTAKVRVCD